MSGCEISPGGDMCNYGRRFQSFFNKEFSSKRKQIIHFQQCHWDKKDLTEHYCSLFIVLRTSMHFAVLRYCSKHSSSTPQALIMTDLSACSTVTRVKDRADMLRPWAQFMKKWKVQTVLVSVPYFYILELLIFFHLLT